MARKLALVLACGLLLATPAAADNSAKIAALHAKIAAARAHEAQLNAEIRSVTREIRSLESRVGDVSQQLSILERDLELHQRRLDKLNALYKLQTERLIFLRREFERAVRTLSRQMIDIYESRDPTLVEVIINSDSFQEALDHIHYLNSIAAQGKQIAADVAVARDEMKATRAKTKKTRAAVAAATKAVAVRTAQQRALRTQLLATQGRLTGARHSKKAALVATRAQEREWIAEADTLAAQDARVRAQLAAAQASTPSQSAPSQSASDQTPSSSGFIWPVNGPVVSPFGMRWGRLHAGIDIAAPSGTPIHAAASGRVVLAGWTGGYGNYTCIDHGGGIATCYAHQSSIAVGSGQSVSQGQVIGYVGCTGHCFGPHLHFEVRVNGTPVDPLGYL
jgi:murein DD-endopeptidase MepM/ murein hydrolase activator NlpD